MAGAKVVVGPNVAVAAPAGVVAPDTAAGALATSAAATTTQATTAQAAPGRRKEGPR